MKLGLNLNIKNNSVMYKSNICIIIIGTSGDWRGHISGSGSVISPGSTFAGISVFEYKWNIVTGEFVISFGDTGDDELANTTNSILIYHPKVPDGNSAIFDISNTDYRFTDLVLAEYIGSDISRTCFFAEFQPIELVRINYSQGSIVW